MRGFESLVLCVAIHGCFALHEFSKVAVDADGDILANQEDRTRQHVNYDALVVDASGSITDAAMKPLSESNPPAAFHEADLPTFTNAAADSGPPVVSNEAGLPTAINVAMETQLDSRPPVFVFERGLPALDDASVLVDDASVLDFIPSVVLNEATELRQSFDHVFTSNVLDWNSSLRESLEAAMPSINESLVQTLSSGSYSYIQFVGLSFYTFPSNFIRGHGAKPFYAGIDSMVASHAKDVVNNVEDATARVNVLIKMMEEACKSQYVDKDPSVLKLFMAPEFFFRGPNGAYNMKHLGGCITNDGSNNGFCNAGIVKILELLSMEVRKQTWKDWLFVMGTIVSVIPGEKLAWNNVAPSKYFNFAPVMQGGPHGVGKHQIIGKTYVSGIDFLSCEKTSEGDECVANPIDSGISKYAVFNKAQKADLGRLGFQLVDGHQCQFHGLTFMVEVCLDHSVRANANTGEVVDVHLVTSAGMSIMYSAARNGPIFLQDGGSDGAKSEYKCPGCNTKSDGLAYSGTQVVKSPDGHCPPLTTIVYGTTQVSTPRATDKCYSKPGYATEGSGSGIDPRFKMALINGLFAVDAFTPQINIGPAFQLTAARPSSGAGGSNTCRDAAYDCRANAHLCNVCGVQQQCQQTCGKCGATSACCDSANDCAAHVNSCKYANVQQQCKQTCGVCSSTATSAPACNDAATNCWQYATQCGVCNVQKHCRKTCGLCGATSTCCDYAGDCAAHAMWCFHRGIQDQCQRTCRVCNR
mmetsp:Transcript_113462/g.177389  ORF Transcript_113462/g.177389 Transcript_113462/m.177389 type:complete len:754 (+) Transcript_113462:49-2310(+)